MIKTNSLDQVLHFSLSEQPGRMKEDKDDCKHHPCHPTNGRKELLSQRQHGSNASVKLGQARQGSALQARQGSAGPWWTRTAG